MSRSRLPRGPLRHARLYSIAAFTAAGLLLGPATGIVDSTEGIEIFLSIGIFILFFNIALSAIDLPGLMVTIRGPYVVAAIVSVVFSVLASMIVTSDLLGTDSSLNLEFGKALSLAGILSLSSLGIVAKVLSDCGILKELLGLRTSTSVVVAELITLLLIGTKIRDLDHKLIATGVLRLVGDIAVCAIATWALSAKVLPRAIDLVERYPKVAELWFGLLAASCSWSRWVRSSGCTARSGPCCSVPALRAFPTAHAGTSCREC